MYIALEGIDTSGKSTQIASLRNYFIDAIFIKEPGYTELGKQIREIVLNKHIVSKKAELFLFLADRSELIDSIIKPNRKKLIISDRSFISGIGYALEFELDFLIGLNRFALDNLLPDGIAMLVLDKDELENRLLQKNRDRIEKNGIEYLLSVQSRMIEAIKRLKIESIFIDAKKDKVEISKLIVEFIKSLKDTT